MNAGETAMAPGWTLVFAPQRIACMKLMTLAVPAARGEGADRRPSRGATLTPSFRACTSSRSPRDIDKSRVPVFVAAYLRDAFAHRSVG